jgi:hypothetical protein
MRVRAPEWLHRIRSEYIEQEKIDCGSSLELIILIIFNTIIILI